MYIINRIRLFVLFLLALLTLLTPLQAQEFDSLKESEGVWEEGFGDEGDETFGHEEGVFEAKPSTFGTQMILFIFEPDFGRENRMFTLGSGEEFERKIQLEEGKHLYELSLPIMEDNAHLSAQLGDRQTILSLPHRPEEGPIYIGMRQPRLFPHGIDVWTQDDILHKGEPIRLEVEGEVPIGMIDQVALHIPFHGWPETSTRIAGELAPADDWKLSEFRLYGSVTRETIVFLQMGDRYFPILTDGHRRHNIRLRFEEKNSWFVLQEVEDSNAGQLFLNERYENMGMSQRQYQDWVRTFDTPASAKTLLLQLQQEMADTGIGREEVEKRLDELIEDMVHPKRDVFRNQDAKQRHIWEMRERILEYSRIEQELDGGMGELLHALHELDHTSWKHAFARSYEKKIENDQHKLWHRRDAFHGFVIPGFFLSFFLFVIGIIAVFRRPKSFLSRHFLKIELITQGFLALLLADGLLFNHWHAGVMTASTVYAWLLFITAIVSFYLNVYLFAPQLSGKGKLGRYFIHLALLVAGIVASYAIHGFNPLGDYAFVSFGGDWTILDKATVGRTYRMDDFVAFQVMVLLFSTIYGFGRNLLIRRLPQLTQKSNALNAELGALKHQISPHFFFNSLNTVYSYSLIEDSPKTSEAITKLSDMMRFVIYDGAQEKISLQKELTYLEDYIELQQLRLDPEKHQFNFRVDGEPKGLQIAPLILITLIENAFKHGISMSQPSFIYISLLIQEGGLILSVENSNHAAKVIAGEGETREGGVGMVNTRQRLDLLYPNRYDWYVEEKGDSYFTQLSIDLS